MRILTVVLTACALCGFLAASAAACSIIQPSVAGCVAPCEPLPEPDPVLDDFNASDLAITGRVTKIRFLGPPPSAVKPATGEGPYEATIRISRVYKGKTGPALRIRSTTDQGLCGLKLRVGQRLGLLLHGTRSPWSIGGSSRIPWTELERVSGGRSHRPGTR